MTVANVQADSFCLLYLFHSASRWPHTWCCLFPLPQELPHTTHFTEKREREKERKLLIRHLKLTSWAGGLTPTLAHQHYGPSSQVTPGPHCLLNNMPDALLPAFPCPQPSAHMLPSQHAQPPHFLAPHLPRLTWLGIPSVPCMFLLPSNLACHGSSVPSQRNG